MRPVWIYSTEISVAMTNYELCCCFLFQSSYNSTLLKGVGWVMIIIMVVTVIAI